MLVSEAYRRQVTLLVRVLPFVAEEACLRSKAGLRSICSSATCQYQFRSVSSWSFSNSNFKPKTRLARHSKNVHRHPFRPVLRQKRSPACPAALD